MNAASSPTERDLLLDLCDGQADAVDLILGAWRFAEVYDDLIDGEKRETDQAIHEAVQWALFGLHGNAFYLRHRASLAPALQVAIAEWRAANELERSGEVEQLVTAYTLRCSPYTFFVAVVLAAGGPAAAVRAAEFFRARPSADRLEAYLREHQSGE